MLPSCADEAPDEYSGSRLAEKKGGSLLDESRWSAAASDLCFVSVTILRGILVKFWMLAQY